MLSALIMTHSDIALSAQKQVCEQASKINETWMQLASNLWRAKLHLMEQFCYTGTMNERILNFSNICTLFLVHGFPSLSSIYASKVSTAHLEKVQHIVSVQIGQWPSALFYAVSRFWYAQDSLFALFIIFVYTLYTHSLP